MGRPKSKQIEELGGAGEPAFGHLDDFMPAPLPVIWAIVHEEQIPLCQWHGVRATPVSRLAHSSTPRERAESVTDVAGYRPPRRASLGRGSLNRLPAYFVWV